MHLLKHMKEVKCRAFNLTEKNKKAINTHHLKDMYAFH